MAKKSEYPGTPPRLRNLHTASPVYFVTCCTQDRQLLLANDIAHDAFLGFVQRGYDDHHVAVGRYVIMPDHIHLFIRGPYDFKLSVWVNQLKGFLTKKIRCSRSPEANESPAGRLLQDGPVWQRGFFDHVLRNHESYSEKWAYVEQNPVRAGLVETASDWPYAGCITEIRL